MATQYAYTTTELGSFTDTTTYGQSFAALLRRNLGSSIWSKLEPAIAARFLPLIGETNSLKFIGNMEWVYCSMVGKVIARVLKRFAILPSVCARDTDFDFTIGVKNGVIKKQRGYAFGQAKRFLFTSTFSESPVLHEEFAGGLGMYLKLAVKRGALLFRDQGYFWRIGRWRLPLPRWLSVGRFELLHRNIDQNRFQILIKVTHPIFGTLFYQRGEFQVDRQYVD